MAPKAEFLARAVYAQQRAAEAHRKAVEATNDKLAIFWQEAVTDWHSSAVLNLTFASLSRHNHAGA